MGILSTFLGGSEEVERGAPATWTVYWAMDDREGPGWYVSGPERLEKFRFRAAAVAAAKARGIDADEVVIGNEQPVDGHAPPESKAGVEEWNVVHMDGINHGGRGIDRSHYEPGWYAFGEGDAVGPFDTSTGAVLEVRNQAPDVERVSVWDEGVRAPRTVSLHG